MANLIPHSTLHIPHSSNERTKLITNPAPEPQGIKASPTGGKATGRRVLLGNGMEGAKRKEETMAVLYRVYKDNRENSLTSGQYFARAIHTDTIGLKEMAMEIEENVSVKYSDVSAVLIELVNVMNRHLNASRRVKLDGFGAFKIGLKTKGALREEDFSATKNIVGSRVLFQPEYTVDVATQKRNRQFLSNVTVRNVKDLLPKEEESGQQSSNP